MISVMLRHKISRWIAGGMKQGSALPTDRLRVESVKVVLDSGRPVYADATIEACAGYELIHLQPIMRVRRDRQRHITLAEAGQ